MSENGHMSDLRFQSLENRIESVQGQIDSLSTKVDDIPDSINARYSVIRDDIHKLELAINSCTSQMAHESSSKEHVRLETTRRLELLERVVHGSDSKEPLAARIRSLEESRKVVFKALGAIGATLITIVLQWLSTHLTLGGP